MNLIVFYRQLILNKVLILQSPLGFDEEKNMALCNIKLCNVK